MLESAQVVGTSGRGMPTAAATRSVSLSPILRLAAVRWRVNAYSHQMRTIVPFIGRVPSRVVYPDQVAILRRVSARETTKKALAAKLHISREWLDRVMLGEVALGAETCLRVALEYDENALSVMRAAGKGELADLLERAGFGTGEVSVTDRDLLRDLESLPDAQQRPIRELIRSLSTRSSLPPRKSRRRS